MEYGRCLISYSIGVLVDRRQRDRFGDKNRLEEMTKCPRREFRQGETTSNMSWTVRVRGPIQRQESGNTSKKRLYSVTMCLEFRHSKPLFIGLRPRRETGKNQLN